MEAANRGGLESSQPCGTSVPRLLGLRRAGNTSQSPDQPRTISWHPVSMGCGLPAHELQSVSLPHGCSDGTGTHGPGLLMERVPAPRPGGQGEGEQGQLCACQHPACRFAPGAFLASFLS